MTLLHYVSHPEVRIDPEVPVPRWGLSETGRRRAAAMLTEPWVRDVTAVVASPETKALETATLLADHLGLPVEVRPGSGEVDRSATGYVSHDRHEELTDLLFARPGGSAGGWERAVDAQQRIVGATRDLVAGDIAAGDGEGLGGDGGAGGDVVIVGHGGVGTLLYCHLAGLAIDRRHDQPGQGHRWVFDRRTRRLVHGWRPIGPVTG